MKSLCLSVWTLVSFLVLDTFGAKALPLPRKHALIVGITGYGRGKSSSAVIQELNTVPDVLRMKAILSQAPYRFDNVVCLSSPEQTTRESILLSFQSLIAEVSEGDIVYVHISGHGSQRANPNDMQFGLDQTIVPSNCPAPQDRSKDITDKELRDLLRQLAQKGPASVFLAFDSCHSGGISRGGIAHLVRGLPGEVATRGPSADDQPKSRGFGLWGAREGSGFVVLSACRNDQLDYEVSDDRGKPMGSLTYALARALCNLQGENVTYRDVFDQVRCTFKEKGLTQEPVIEGPIDTAVFGSRNIKREPSIPVLIVGTQAWLDAGQAHGMVPGSQVAIYPRGTNNFSSVKPVCYAEVSDRIEEVRSLLKLATTPTKTAFQQLRGAPARIISKVYGGKPLTLDIGGLADRPQNDTVTATLRKLQSRGIIRLTKGYCDYRLCSLKSLLNPGSVLPLQGTVRIEGSSGAKSIEISTTGFGAEALLLQRSDGSFVKFPNHRSSPGASEYQELINVDDSLESYLEDGLRRESRGRLLNGLAAPGHSLKIRLIPCEVATNPRKGESGQQPECWQRDLSSGDGLLPELETGDWFRLEVANFGTKPVYGTILDLMSDGRLGAVWPHPAFGEINNKVDPGDFRPIFTRDVSGLTAGEKQSYYQLFRTTPPAGEEQFVVISTSAQTNFSFLLDQELLDSNYSGKLAARGSPLEQILLDYASGKRREIVPRPSSASSWGASMYRWKIRESRFPK